MSILREVTGAPNENLLRAPCSSVMPLPVLSKIRTVDNKFSVAHYGMNYLRWYNHPNIQLQSWELQYKACEVES